MVFSGSNNWKLKVVKTIRSKPDILTNRNIIKPFTINQLFTSSYLAIGVIVSNSRSTWKHGGQIAQQFYLLNTGKYLTNNTILKDFVDLKINEINLVKFDDFANNYQIKYFPQNYFNSLELRIWEYQKFEAILSQYLKLIKKSITDLEFLIEKQSQTLNLIINQLDCNNSTIIIPSLQDQKFFFIN